MKLKLRAILYAVIISVLPLAAAECSTAEQVRKDVATFKPPASIVEMDKKETEAFLQVYNSIPPVSTARGDYSMVITGRAPVVVYVYFRENCAVETLFMKRHIFDKILETAMPELAGQKA